MIPYICLVLGLVFIFIEFFLPGGILGIFGGLLCLAGLVFSIVDSKSFYEILSFVIIGTAGVAFVIYYALYRIRHSKNKANFYLEQDQEGYKAVSYDETLIGAEGITDTRCVPAGYVIIQQKRYQALSQGGFIAKGTPIKVIGGQGACLTVLKISEEKRS